LVTGSGNNKTTLKSVKSNDIDDVLTNFSPISKERAKIYPELTEEIDILIGTDCISEGQNLQDCDYLVNYDIHWNPVRIVQRFGRIDRIGSKNKHIQLHNFWSNMELNEYIDLSGRVEIRMVMVDLSSTGDDNPIVNEPIESYQAVKTEIGYREKQLQRLKDEVVDLEDVSGGISITDLTFNDFKVELMEYLKGHKKELEEVPNGIYSIVEIDEEFKEDLKEGVIFLLRQTRGTADSKDQNPLTPYYLVYVNEDGTTAFNYTSSKKIMDFYKKLCSGKKEVFKKLIYEFNKETKDGTKMERYSDLLKIAIEGILGKKEAIGKKSVFTKGGTTPVRGNMSGVDEFELVTFLILK
jgi:SNF2 family DNA or RNA helicase